MIELSPSLASKSFFVQPLCYLPQRKSVFPPALLQPEDLLDDPQLIVAFLQLFLQGLKSQGRRSQILPELNFSPERVFCPLRDEIPLELSKDPEHTQKALPHSRSGVKRLGNALKANCLDPPRQSLVSSLA